MSKIIKMRSLKQSFIVYMATNTITGHRYIGATSRGIKIRQNGHISDALAGRDGCRRFNRAIRKYGPDAFAWSILVRCKTFKGMMRKEIQLIKELQPEYNITRGGQGIQGLVRTKSWCNKISQALKGRSFSPERVAKMRLQDYSFAHKPVVCLNDNKWFPSIKEAAAYYKLTCGRISEALSKRQISTAGLFFIKSAHPISKNLAQQKLLRKQEYRLRRTTMPCHNREVVCLTNGIHYHSMAAAARVYHSTNASIMAACQFGIRANGHYFRYADQKGFPKRNVLPLVERQRRIAASSQKLVEKTKKPVVVVETGQTYESIRAAADQLGINRGMLYAAINFNRRCCGLTVKLIDKAA